MSKLKFIWDKEEEKEEEKPGWLQRTGGIGELPELPTSTKLKFTGAVGLGLGAKATGGITLPETTPIKPISEIEAVTGFNPEVGAKETKELTSILQGDTSFQDPKMIESHKANFESWRLWLKELKESKDKLSFLKGEGKSPELIEAQKKSDELLPYMYGEKGGKWLNTIAVSLYSMGLVSEIIPILSQLPANILNNLAYKVEGKTVKGKELFDVIRRVATPPMAGYGEPSAFDKQVFEKFVSEGSRSVAQRMAEGIKVTTTVPRFAFGAKLYAGLPADEIAKSIVAVGKVTAEAVKGLDPVKVSQVTQMLLNTSPALASEFLKAVEKPEGIPQVKEEPLKKVTPPAEPKEELKAEVKPPIPVEFKDNNPQIFEYKDNKFLTTDNTLGMGKVKDIRVWNGESWKFTESKRGFGDFSKRDLDRITENLKLMPKPPSAIEPAPTEAVKAKEPAPKEEVGKVEPKEFITKDQYNELKKYYQSINELPPHQMTISGAKYGSIKYQKYEYLTNDFLSQLTDKYKEIIKAKPTEQYTKIPATIDEAKEILKFDPKKLSQPKELLAKQMIAKKVSLADIEAVKGEKIDVTKPKDILIALRDIKAVKKEVVTEPTSKAIPKEFEPLAEEAIVKPAEAVTEQPAVVEAPAPAKPPIPPSPPTKAEMAGEPIGDPIAKLNELIKQAKPRRGRLETEYTKERARRIAEVERAIDEIGGEKGYIVALSKLKGQLAPTSKYLFEPIKDKLSKEEIDALYNRDFKHPYLDEWEKISAANELTKLLSGELPTPKGLVLLEEIYGTDLIKSILSKRALGLKVADVLIDVANIPRAILATADMSGFLRQGIVYVVSHPVIATKAMGKTFQFAFNSKSFEQYFKDLPKDKLYPLMRKSGLAVTDPSRVLATGREEAFISRLMQQIPVIGQIIKFAERAYVGFLNKLRVDVFKTFADEFLSKGFSPVKDKDLFKATAEVVNTFTGRGSLGNLNRITPFLNTIFFSPRLIMARFNALNPIWYTRQPKEIRIKALGDFAKFVAVGLTLLAIIKTSGLGDVETDPRSSDFGKIKIGNTRWDIWGGFQQWVRVFSQFITGKRKNTATGEIISLTKEDYPFTTRKEIVLRFIEGKLAPVPALVNELVSGAKTFEGEDITFETVAREKFIPMYIQDITDAYMDGGLGRAVGSGITAFFGVGVQTWQERKSKEPLKITMPEGGKLTFTKPKLDIQSTKLKFNF